MISYNINLNQNAHTYHVTLCFNSSKSTEILKLPTWIPGSYMLREFSKNIGNITCKQDDKNIECVFVDKSTWLLSNLCIGKIVKVIYTVYAYEFGIRSAFLDSYRGYFNCTSLCLFVMGQEQEPHAIEFLNLPKTWRVASGANISQNKYTVASYDELIDCPFELGEFTKLKFKINNVQHYFILSGSISLNFDQERFIADVSKICKTQIDLFGGVAPYNEYTFILYLGNEIYTGLEHRNSTLLNAPYYSLPMYQTINMNDDYLKLLGLISHEFFHTWNIKRIKPSIFTPYNLEHENYTRLLWWFEGVTSYYDDLILLRCGLIDNERYLGLIVDNINNVYKYNGVKEQSLSNSSLTSWIKYYRQDENSPNALVSYYVKGSLVGMCLDLLIRIKTKSQKSLDNVITNLFKKWQTDGLGIDEDQLNLLIKEYTGLDLSWELDYFINSCLELPYPQLLGRFGVTTHIIDTAKHSNHGKVITHIDELPSQPCVFDLGCNLVKDSIGYKVTNVYTGGIGEQIGLGANDTLLAVNNIKLTDIEKQLSLYKVGDTLNLTIFRQEKLLSFNATYQPVSVVKLTYLQISNAELLSNWLRQR